MYVYKSNHQNSIDLFEKGVNKFWKLFNVRVPKTNNLACGSEKEADDRHWRYMKMNPTAWGVFQEWITILPFYFLSRICPSFSSRC